MNEKRLNIWKIKENIKPEVFCSKNKQERVTTSEFCLQSLNAKISFYERHSSINYDSNELWESYESIGPIIISLTNLMDKMWTDFSGHVDSMAAVKKVIQLRYHARAHYARRVEIWSNKINLKMEYEFLHKIACPLKVNQQFRDHHRVFLKHRGDDVAVTYLEQRKLSHRNFYTRF